MKAPHNAFSATLITDSPKTIFEHGSDEEKSYVNFRKMFKINVIVFLFVMSTNIKPLRHNIQDARTNYNNFHGVKTAIFLVSWQSQHRYKFFIELKLLYVVVPLDIG